MMSPQGWGWGYVVDWSRKTNSLALDMDKRVAFS